MKDKPFAWHVLRWDVNFKSLAYYDVVPMFMYEYKKLSAKKRPKTRAELSAFLMSEGKYHFWSRCEHEIMVGGMFGDEREKIDVWSQLEMNWEAFVDAFCRSVGFKE